MSNTWMQTVSGVVFEPLQPQLDRIHIEDIAHGLSMICRFGGHSREFYSVAEHSVYVSLACDPADAMAGLLHDAAEAYVGDMIRPLKHMPEMTFYRDAEDWVLDTIFEKAGLPSGGGEQLLPPSVKHADNAVLAAERDHPRIVGGATAPWAPLPMPAAVRFGRYNPVDAKKFFLDRFDSLGGVRF